MVTYRYDQDTTLSTTIKPPIIDFVHLFTKRPTAATGSAEERGFRD